MPTALVKRIDLDKIYPAFLERFLALLAKLQAKGHDYYAVSGYRSYEEQAYKYSLGRTRPGARITNAMPGFSMHQYGLAIDCARDENTKLAGLQTTWATDKGQYDSLRDEAIGMGIQVGVPSVPGGDKGHVQLAVVQLVGLQEMQLLSKLKSIYLKNGLSACWSWLDANVKWP